MLSSARWLLAMLSCCLVTVTLRADEAAKHWAYQPVRPPVIPNLTSLAERARSPIDRFVLARLEHERIAPANETDKARLLRRVTLTLTGLPPSLEELDAFLADHSPDAYERVVDRLLASPRYGERMATFWLDLARYADTHGYHADAHRDMWRWRDWVIEAFNHDLPFDQFTIEQLAGDLLPNATLEQRLATGFNRNHMINAEEGAIAEEYRTEYVADRVQTTATVWLAQTIQCARCHDHKHDPFSMRDYYRLFAFFNNVPENGVDGLRGNAAPLMAAPTIFHVEQLANFDRQIASLEKWLSEQESRAEPNIAAWERSQRGKAVGLSSLPDDAVSYLPLDEVSDASVFDKGQRSAAKLLSGSPTPLPGKVSGGLALDGETAIQLPGVASFERTDSFSFSAWLFPTTSDEMCIAYLGDERSLTRRGVELSLNDGRLQFRITHRTGTQPENAIEVRDQQPLPLRKWHAVAWTYDGSSRAAGVQIYVGGEVRELKIVADHLDGTVQVRQPWRIGRRGDDAGFRGILDEVRIFDRVLRPVEVSQWAGENPHAAIFAMPRERRTAEQQRTLVRYFLQSNDAEYAKRAGELADVRRERDRFQKSLPTVMVMSEQSPRRETFVLQRGQYDSRGERVAAGVPEIFPSRSQASLDNRLAFSRWLVSPENPLTTRVTANRLWQLHFGVGLVSTSDDFGRHGAAPSHPQLLDWLATEFAGVSDAHSMALRWSMKRTQREIVCSATFRQRSRASGENVLGQFAPRQRLSAEFIRDLALHCGGLLTSQIGGRSMFPQQPPGLWEEVAFAPKELGAQSYEPSRGAELYRRSLYVFWKRAVPPPSLAIFDAPDREVCVATRPRSDSPLQALLLMNEPLRLEAASGLAWRMIHETKGEIQDAAAIVSHGFRIVTCRLPTATERETLLELFHAAHESSPPDNKNKLHFAALIVANVLLSMEESLYVD